MHIQNVNQKRVYMYLTPGPLTQFVLTKLRKRGKCVLNIH